MTVYKDIKIQLPKWVSYIIDTLQKNDYEAYVVGGCVRDSLLNRQPKDWDITTNAKPNEVIEIFESLGYKIIPTGLKHGTVTIVIDKEQFEVTTYRIDGEYTNGRQPDNVTFTNSLKEDLSRRDFTVNAMAYSEKEGLIDYFGGMGDLKYKEINCVGEANQRFKEDKLRILRAIRFASRYDFNIYKSVFYAIDEDNDIAMLSKERIQSEFNKIILSEKPSLWLNMMFELGLLQQIIPEISDCYRFEQKNPHHNKDVYEHILSVIDHTEPILELRLAALFHDIAKPQTFSLDENGVGHFYEHHKESARVCEEAMKRLKYSNTEIENVRELVYWHMTQCDYNKPKAVKKFLRNVGVERLDNLFKLKVADICGSKIQYKDLENVFKLKFDSEKILSEKQPLSVKDLAINGNDLMSLGIKQGKEIGKILNQLLELVLENAELNNKEYLRMYVKNSLCKF
ncbi:CCA tRNA nucleotidyltransferase [Clostridium sp.]|uniref:CCA tRNA nucleotidyltransferase n=1 Tax=Clostridium sp. TaxID=1506 RepID=UPI00262F8D6F|nr:CCA tRNA nucleotidyltransferase [Clostridium sp.]